MENNTFSLNHKIGGFENGGYDSKAIYPIRLYGVGITSFVGPNDPKIIKKTEISYYNVPSSGIAIDSNERVYYGGTQGIRCIDAKGNEVWIHTSDQYNFTSPVLTQTNKLIVGTVGTSESKEEKIYSINLDGEISWERDIVGGAVYPPLIDQEENIYVATYENFLYKLNSEGEGIYTFQGVKGFGTVPLLKQNGDLIIGLGDRKLYCIDKEGRVKWESKQGNFGIREYPVIDKKDVMYFNIAFEGSIFLRALNTNNGKVIWDYKPSEGDIITSPSLDNEGNLYVGANYFRMICVSPNGIEKWQVKLDGFMFNPPVIDRNGVNYTVATNEVRRKCKTFLYAHDSNGNRLWKQTIDGEAESVVIGPDKSMRLLVRYPSRLKSELVHLSDK